MPQDHPAMSLNGWNAEYVDELYEQWAQQPDSVDPQWQQFFRGFELGAQRHGGGEAAAAEAPPAGVQVAHTRQGKVDSLIYHYRDIGHFAADLDPLGKRRPAPSPLGLETFGLSEADLDERFDPGLFPLPNEATLREIVSGLSDTYCRTVGVEYMHIQDREERQWLQQQMEPVRNRPAMSREQKMRILRELADADALESFLNVRYRGKKRFSLEGAEALNPMLAEIIELGPGRNVEEFALGMAHRGRINVLVNILQKTYGQLFTEFEEAWVEDFLEGGGDVKYHRGYSSDYVTSSGESVRLTLSPNPSHLEFGHSTVLGRARAKQRLRKDEQRETCVPILIHGDAAFPGQGIVAEMFNMSQLRGYTVGGALHIVVNNQIGFTTDPSDAHSGDYCTDIAKMVQAPIFHVNGHDPEACVWVARLALEYRQRFKKDVVVDLWCYRKFGHNETDEPSFTQPLMYERVKAQMPLLQIYSRQLIEEGATTQEEVDRLYEDIKEQLDVSQSRAKEEPVETNVPAFGSVWQGLTAPYSDEPVETKVSLDELVRVSEALGRVPGDFHLHRKLKKMQEHRGSAVAQDEPLEWAMGEMLAYGTLLLEGHPVRLTGQDCERGTFSHRHAVLFDQKDGHRYVPLNHLAEDQPRFRVYNSPLTESACLGFEYGYSLGDPHMLVLWEAQFGDFVNGAQVIIDQFIASAEIKWKRHSGLVLLLPHGYEGQGPEHSSARLERFLTLCARNNMQVVYPTTPAQMFHVLRRQLQRSFRKPLVIMTPKSLLRHPQAVSRVHELTEDRFHHLLDDPAAKNPKQVKRLLFCSGKVYYDLAAHREEVEREDVAILRLEQLYPFRAASVQAALEKYSAAQEIVWVQEEPRNMGAWPFISETFRDELGVELKYIGRDRSATPAVASTKMHHQEQQKIMVSAIGLGESAAESAATSENGKPKRSRKPAVAKAS